MATAAEVLAKWKSPVDGSAVTVLDPLQRYHFSNAKKLIPHTMQPPQGKFLFKPEGLWYFPGKADLDSDDEDDGWTWLDWCVEDGGESFLRPYLYRIELPPVNRVLQLHTPHDLIQFTQRWGVHELGWKFTRQIAWEALWQEYNGIEIVPYQWECRLEPRTHWYYSWDCASGCLWRMPFGDMAVELIGVNPDAHVDKR